MGGDPHPPGGRKSVGPRQGKEDGAARTRHARAHVMIDFDDEIVELVVPPQTVAAVAVGALERTVVAAIGGIFTRSEEHTSELQSRQYLVCRLLLEKKKKKIIVRMSALKLKLSPSSN